MSEPEMINLGGGELPDAVEVTMRANWAMAAPEGPDAPVHPLFPTSRISTVHIPPLLDRGACARCSHGLHDVMGFVVTYTHLSQNGVRFTDIAYVEGAQGYDQARRVRDEAIARILGRRVDATSAVIHWVYEGGHRTS